MSTEWFAVEPIVLRRLRPTPPFFSVTPVKGRGFGSVMLSAAGITFFEKWKDEGWFLTWREFGTLVMEHGSPVTPEEAEFRISPAVSARYGMDESSGSGLMLDDVSPSRSSDDEPDFIVATKP